MENRRILGIKILFLLIAAIIAFGCSGSESRKMSFFEKGMAYYDAQELGKARLEFKNALQIDPRFAKGYLMLGRVELAEKNWRMAFVSLSQAIDLDNGLTDAHESLGMLHLMAGQVEKAKERAQIVLNQDPRHTGGLILYAACLIREGRDNQAEEILNGLVIQNPSSQEPYFALSTLHVNRADWDNAILVLEKLVKIDPENKPALLRIAWLHEQKGSFAGAENYLKELAEKNPQDANLKISLARFYQRTQKTQKAKELLQGLVLSEPENISYRLALADLLGQQGLIAQRKQILEEAAIAFADEYEVHEMLAGQYLEENRTEKALALLDGFIGRVRSGQGYFSASVYKAVVLVTLGEKDKALSLVESVLRENPKDIRALTLKADILAQQGDFPGAIGALRTVAHEDPINIDALLRLATVYQANGNKNLAVETYENVLKIDDKNLEAPISLAEIHLADARPDRAKSHLSRVLIHYPEDMQALSLMGAVALQEGDQAGAKRVYSKLLAIDPQSLDAHLGMGRIMDREGDFSSAIKHFEKILEKEPDHVAALLGILDVLVRGGQMQKALERAGAQAALRPQNADFQLFLGSLNLSDGNFDEAMRHLKNAVEKAPDHREALMALAGVKRKIGNPEEALELYLKVFNSNSADADAAIRAALVLDELSRHAQAGQVLERALEKQPDAVTLRNNLAFHYAQYEPSSANLARALRLISPLLHRYPDVLGIQDTGAWVHYASGDYEKALDILSAVGPQALASPVIRYHLGMVHLKLGDSKTARTHLTAALESGQDFPGKEDARTALESL